MNYVFLRQIQISPVKILNKLSVQGKQSELCQLNRPFSLKFEEFKSVLHSFQSRVQRSTFQIILISPGKNVTREKIQKRKLSKSPCRVKLSAFSHLDPGSEKWFFNSLGGHIHSSHYFHFWKSQRISYKYKHIFQIKMKLNILYAATLFLGSSTLEVKASHGCKLEIYMLFSNIQVLVWYSSPLHSSEIFFRLGNQCRLHHWVSFIHSYWYGPSLLLGR